MKPAKNNVIDLLKPLLRFRKVIHGSIAHGARAEIIADGRGGRRSGLAYAKKLQPELNTPALII